MSAFGSHRHSFPRSASGRGGDALGNQAKVRSARGIDKAALLMGKCWEICDFPMQSRKYIVNFMETW